MTNPTNPHHSPGRSLLLVLSRLLADAFEARAEALRQHSCPEDEAVGCADYCELAAVDALAWQADQAHAAIEGMSTGYDTGAAGKWLTAAREWLKSLTGVDLAGSPEAESPVAVEP